ncbi:type I polyketide synthase [Alkalihalobacillus sp. TS-13]|uniref:type I polyketide synthase n=1 Tax=Alkalihalobacillus sp. TS-13 TaxID=2842455 RepID=UPI001C883522|nr:type I polyketide synthase [Alkalihalobacillus sp. TS-13]
MENINPCDIAVVGVSALFPGSVDKTGFWNDILSGKDLISEVPPTHWLPEEYYDVDPSIPDKTYAKRGGFLSDTEFDPMEFGIPPKNLSATDVSQLLALVVAKKVLEDAADGQFERIDRDNISVILGFTCGTSLAMEMASRIQRPVWIKTLRDSGLPESQVQEVCDRISSSYSEWQENTFPGLLGNVIAGRISNRFDLGGTNTVVDAACASSLSALSMAAMELTLGKSDLVITGGVDIFNEIFMYICFSKTPALSPTGDCRPFSDESDGTILGEGIGMVALKRLKDAERDGDRIYAVLKGVGSASDGYDKSIYAPRPEGQAKALRRAYEAAGYSPKTVELMEAHGTGTKAGDAAEIQGLSLAFSDGQPVENSWCALGSIKSQIGHTKGAAGAAGLFKVVMALHHKLLPPTIKIDRPNPKLALDQSPFYLNTRARPWIRDHSHPRRASVSAFGFGGSNFHVTLEEYKGPGRKARCIRSNTNELFLWSAQNASLLTKMIITEAERKEPFSNRDFLLLARRSQENFDALQPFRLAIIASDGADLQRKLKVAAKKTDNAERFFSPQEGIFYGAELSSGKIAFLFPGQGSQYVDMGSDVTMRFDSAREIWDRAALEMQLHQLVFPPPAFSEKERKKQSAQLTKTQWAQPGIGVTSNAILSVLSKVGVEPAYAAGHSFGELTALFASGVWNESDFLKISKKRGELMSEASSEAGTMTAVFTDRETIEGILEQLESSTVIANYNSPRQFILSGKTEEIEKAESELLNREIRFQRLKVSTAFHSELVAPSVHPFRAFLRDIDFNNPKFPVYSNVVGELYPDDKDLIRETIAEQIANPVLFEQQLQSMYEKGVRTFVEVGPHSALTGLVRQCFEGEDVFAVATDQKGNDGVTQLWNALGQLSVLGVSMNLGFLWEQYEPLNNESSETKSKFKITLNGANYGKPYPPVGGGKNLPGPNTHPEESISFQPVNHEKRPIIQRSEVKMRPETRMNQKENTNGDQSVWDTFQELQKQTTEAHITFQQTIASVHTTYLQSVQSTFSRLDQLVAEGTEVAEYSEGSRTEFHDSNAEYNPGPETRTAQLAVPTIESELTPPPNISSIQQSEPPKANPSIQPIEPATPKSKKQSDAASEPNVETLFLAIVSEKTGYPVEMLELDMGLESELGIDSIKRIEILSALQNKLPDVELKPGELGTLNTLGEIVEYIYGKKKI